MDRGQKVNILHFPELSSLSKWRTSVLLRHFLQWYHEILRRLLRSILSQRCTRSILIQPVLIATATWLLPQTSCRLMVLCKNQSALHCTFRYDQSALRCTFGCDQSALRCTFGCDPVERFSVEFKSGPRYEVATRV